MLKPSVTFALSPDHLMKLVREADDRGQRLVIDCPSFNPLDEADMKRCSDLISYMNVEPVLVLSGRGPPDGTRGQCARFRPGGLQAVSSLPGSMRFGVAGVQSQQFLPRG
jgi:hypothetical protein